MTSRPSRTIISKASSRFRLQKPVHFESLAAALRQVTASQARFAGDVRTGPVRLTRRKRQYRGNLASHGLCAIARDTNTGKAPEKPAKSRCRRGNGSLQNGKNP